MVLGLSPGWRTVTWIRLLWKHEWLRPAIGLPMHKLMKNGMFVLLLICSAGLPGYLAWETRVQWDISQNGHLLTLDHNNFWPALAMPQRENNYRDNLIA
jgi:hypothetical protein